MNRTQLMLAIYAYLTSGLIIYGYMRRNRYLDVLLAGIGVAIVGTSLALSAFGLAAALARALFNLGTGLAIVVAALLGIRLISGLFKPSKSEQKPAEKPGGAENVRHEDEDRRRDKAA